MDALRHLVANIPDWMKRLDELTDQIEKRQIELAQVTESSPVRARSIRNRGSTESLKPKDEPEAHPVDTNPEPAPPLTRPTPATSSPLDTSVAPAKATDPQPPSSPADSNTPSALLRQTNQVKAQAQARARATLRKRQRSDSVVSADGGAPKFRTRSMIIVYYDSYVQSFFEELVKFVSASRNMMRKAKMAAKVAQIKRQAELDMGNDEEGEEKPSARGQSLEVDAGPLLAAHPAPRTSALVADGPLEAAPLEASDDTNTREAEEKLALQYVSSRRMQPVTRVPNMFVTASGRHMYARGGQLIAGPGPRGTGGQLPDVYDQLDKGLEYVQSMCEHAAHQFLRDGDCAEEVGNIQRRLGDTQELADKEMARVQKEEPEALESPPDSAKRRSFRPQYMRREPAGPSSGKDTNMDLEVDESPEEGDNDARLLHKSTRMMH